MTLRRMCRRHASIGLVAVALTASSLTAGIIAQNAAAAPSTKYYTSTATPSSFDVVNTAPSTPNVTFTLTNCGSTTPGCTKASTQSWGSANVVLPASPTTGWNWGYDTSQGPVQVTGLVVHSADTSKSGHWKISDVVNDPVTHTQVVELHNDGTNSAYAVAPGEYLTFTASLTPYPAGLAAVTTEVKQSNDFSGTGNDFLHSGTNTDPTIVIGPPDHLEFGTSSQTVQQTTTANGTTTYYYMCDGSNQGPTVRVVDKSHNTVTWASGTVTLLNESSTDPGLSYASGSPLTHSTTLQETIRNGVATFGSGCTSGLSATHLGAYLLGATANVTGVGALTAPTEKSYAVLQYDQVCGASCPTVTIKGNHTSGGASGSDGSNGSTDRLGISVHVYPDAGGCNPEGDKSNPNREVVSVDLSNHKKQVTLSWDKQTVQIFTNNGTPFWNVCIWTTYPFTVAGGGAARGVTGPPDDTAWFTGLLANCKDVNPGTNPCISDLFRRGGVEFANISLPNVPGDPHFV